MEAIIGVQVRRREAMSRKWTILEKRVSAMWWKDSISARSISEEFSSGDCGRYRDEEATHSGSSSGSARGKEREEKEEETIKVFDGNNSLRRRIYRVVCFCIPVVLLSDGGFFSFFFKISISRHCSCEQLLTASLRAFHITKDPFSFYLTDLYAPGEDEARLQDPHPVLSLHRQEGKRPAIFLRFK